MIIRREWAMPDKWTFRIQLIKKLLDKYVGDGRGWIDPFAGFNSPAEYTNDLNPESPAKYHLEALDFVKQLNGTKYAGCLFDPPYTLTQVSRSYEMLNKNYAERNKLDPTGGFPDVKNIIAPKIKTEGVVITFGYNSVGFGKNRGFEIVEILLLCHGGNHNDTIITVERKFNRMLDAYESIASV